MKHQALGLNWKPWSHGFPCEELATPSRGTPKKALNQVFQRNLCHYSNLKKMPKGGSRMVVRWYSTYFYLITSRCLTFLSILGVPKNRWWDYQNPSSPRAFAKKVTHTQLPTSSFKASFYLVFYQCSQKRSNTVENFWNVGGWKLIGYPFLSWGESPSGHASE